jgi:hypothetical protein
MELADCDMQASGCQARPPMRPVCPFKLPISLQNGIDHNLIAPEKDPVANIFEFGEKFTIEVGLSSTNWEAKLVNDFKSEYKSFKTPL